MGRVWMCSDKSEHFQTARTKFPFPDPPITLKLQDSAKPQLQLQLQQNYPSQSSSPKATSPNPIIDSVKSYDSDKTLSGELNFTIIGSLLRP